MHSLFVQSTHSRGYVRRCNHVFAELYAQLRNGGMEWDRKQAREGVLIEVSDLFVYGSPRVHTVANERRKRT